MNYKLLFPTYRARYRFVPKALLELVGEGLVESGLNLGCGEGDLDPLIKRFCQRLESCDINQTDVAFAMQLNRDCPGIHYSVQDGTRLTYPEGSFDFVACLEVVEHVPDRTKLLREIHRVLKPGGGAVITCPSHDFPITYDPLNLVLRRAGLRIPFGAYGYGHTELIRAVEFEELLHHAGLRVVSRHYLTHALAALTECYWVSVCQRIFKANSGNKSSTGKGQLALKPSRSEPACVSLTDALINLDERLFHSSKRSVGLGFLVRK